MDDSIIYDLIVVGAGASGCVAAITAARRGKKVLLLEKNTQIAKKILVTGNGKCNFTNYDMNASKYNGDKDLIEAMLKQFSVQDAIAFFRSIGISPVERNGYVYPYSNQAKAVTSAFDYALYQSGVKVVTDFCVKHIRKSEDIFYISNSSLEYLAKNVLLSTGLLDSSIKGIESSALDLSKELGHSMNPILPALCGYYCECLNFKRLTGLRVHASISVKVDNCIIGQDAGELQINEYGISGIPVFQLSSIASKALNNNQNVQFVINFLDGFSKEEAITELQYRIDNFKEPLNGLLPDKLSLYSKEILGKNASAEEYYNFLSSITVVVNKAREFQYAQICVGGIKTNELKKQSCESAIISNLYFAGEIIDIDGLCGGYNLHFAWATGHFVGSSIE